MFKDRKVGTERASSSTEVSAAATSNTDTSQLEGYVDPEPYRIDFSTPFKYPAQRCLRRCYRAGVGTGISPALRLRP